MCQCLYPQLFQRLLLPRASISSLERLGGLSVAEWLSCRPSPPLTRHARVARVGLLRACQEHRWGASFPTATFTHWILSLFLSILYAAPPLARMDVFADSTSSCGTLNDVVAHVCCSPWRRHEKLQVKRNSTKKERERDAQRRPTSTASTDTRPNAHGRGRTLCVRTCIAPPLFACFFGFEGCLCSSCKLSAHSQQPHLRLATLSPLPRSALCTLLLPSGCAGKGLSRVRAWRSPKPACRTGAAHPIGGGGTAVPVPSRGCRSVASLFACRRPSEAAGETRPAVSRHTE